jgi:hypothetical protein
VSLRNRGGASCFTLRPNCDMARAMNNDASPTNDHSDNGALPADVMPIPGLSDPMVLPRKPVARADGKRALIGLSKDQLRAALAEIGLPAKQVNMRASQVALALSSRCHRSFGDGQYRQGHARPAG